MSWQRAKKTVGTAIEGQHPVVEAARRRLARAAEAPTSMRAAPSSATGQLERMLRRGVLLSIGPFALLLGGLSIFPIPGAVITAGYLTSESSPKQIQSAESGVIRDILVKDGDSVGAGQQLVLLDDTTARAELAIASKGLEQLQARNARLEAEALDYDEIMFPAELLLRHDEPEVAAILAAERALFALRRDAYRSQLAQMQEQSVQIDAQVKGVEGQVASADKQFTVLTQEAENLRALLKKKLISASRVTEAEQALSVVEGQQAELSATIALARARRAELGSRIAELSATRMSDAAAEQRDVQQKLTELQERQIAAQRRVEQMVLTAPVAGTVTDLRVRTIGGVAAATEQLMTIVPSDDRLIAELKLRPADISKVHMGQGAELHFTSIGGAAAPQFTGTVIYVAPDIVLDPRTGAGHFVVRVEMDDPLNDEARSIGPLAAGTPVEVFLLTEARTVMDYIAKPIIDQARRAFR